VSQTENRLKEAQKLGFCAALAPCLQKPAAIEGIELKEMPDLAQVVGQVFGAG